MIVVNKGRQQALIDHDHGKTAERSAVTAPGCGRAAAGGTDDQGRTAAIADYRDALEAAGVRTEPWWDRQLALSLLGAPVQFGWEKALGGYDEELAWWENKAVAAAPLLG